MTWCPGEQNPDSGGPKARFHDRKDTNTAISSARLRFVGNQNIDEELFSATDRIQQWPELLIAINVLAD
jgi:hypothetical protein